MAKTLRTVGQTTLVSALITARQNAGLSQTELARRLKCHQSLVARIESGQRRIDVQELIILARAIKIDPLEIFQMVINAVPNSERI